MSVFNVCIKIIFQHMAYRILKFLCIIWSSGCKTLHFAHPKRTYSNDYLCHNDCCMHTHTTHTTVTTCSQCTNETSVHFHGANCSRKIDCCFAVIHVRMYVHAPVVMCTNKNISYICTDRNLSLNTLEIILLKINNNHQ